MAMMFVAPVGELTSPIVPSIHARLSPTQLGTRRSLKSPVYIVQERVSCLRLLTQIMLCDLSFALDKAGRIIEAKIAIIAITTSNSIKVKACSSCPRSLLGFIGHSCPDVQIPRLSGGLPSSQ